MPNPTDSRSPVGILGTQSGRKLFVKTNALVKRELISVRFGFVTLGSKVPSTRFRFVPYLPLLEARGHQCHLWTSYPSVYESIPRLGWRLSHCIKRTVRRWQIYQASRLQPDCVYLERGCLNDASLDLDRMLCRTTKRLVLDVDDGIFLEQPEKIDALIQMSDHVVVSNEPIAEYVRERHAQVTIIPTAVSMQRYRAKPLQAPPADTRSSKPVVGWIGTLPNMPFLKVCADALRELARRIEFEFYVVGPSAKPLEEIDLAGVEIKFQTWQADREIADLHRMDIGLMPLPAGKEWMRYKAATKLVQYLAVGIPAVASPIGVNASILADNRVGFAAADHRQWVEGLERLLGDADLRRKMGGLGRELVAEQYSIEANIDRLENVLRAP